MWAVENQLFIEARFGNKIHVYKRNLYQRYRGNDKWIVEVFFMSNPRNSYFLFHPTFNIYSVGTSSSNCTIISLIVPKPVGTVKFECNVPPDRMKAFLLLDRMSRIRIQQLWMRRRLWNLPKLQEQRCFCGRENVELYHEMLRSVGKMRSLISEMKRISGANAKYHTRIGSGR
ncbi:hypothetical protein LOAG_07664 [Loa loa]|uniref:Uncharacterized protein n=1 Tax=Loa loa TaxID=7209 RepID=A0A1S0TX13_LOALO|nr:hypothetical protein LOAG_07664 [Loa loa]EFO20824.1 hypothetical protein LOAG_07664 [Loa loa]